MSERVPRGAVAALAALAAGHATIQIGVLGISAAGSSVGRVESAAVLVAAAFGALVLGRLCLPPASPSNATLSRGFWIALPVLGAGLAVWSMTAALAWRRPVYDWDGLYYHLPAIDAWVSAGRIHWIEALPDIPFVNGYPMAVEALGFLIVQLTGSSRWLDAGNLAFWPLGALGLVVAAASCGARPALAWSAAAGLAAVPMLVAQSATAYVDAAHACCVMATFGAAAWLQQRCERRRAILLGLCAGLTIATKGTGVLLVAVLGLVLVVRLRGSGARWPQLGSTAAVVILTAVLVSGFWYVRNAIHTGNPFHPVGVSLLGHTLFDGVDARAHTLLNLPAWLEPWPALLRPFVSWTQPDAPILGYGAISGLGLVWLLGGLPAAAFFAARIARRRPVPPAVPLLLATGVIVLTLQPAPWWGRFTLWLHALGLPLLVAAIERMWNGKSRTMAALGVTWAAVLVAVGSWEIHGVLRAGAADGRRPDGTYVDSIEYVFPELAAVAPEAWTAPRLARSAWGRWGTLLGGGLAQPAGARRIRVIDDRVVPETLASEGYHWVLWDVRGAGDPPEAFLQAASRQYVYAPSGDRHFVMLDLRDVRVARGR